MIHHTLKLLVFATCAGFGIGVTGCAPLTQEGKDADQRQTSTDIQAKDTPKEAPKNLLLDRPNGTALEQDRWAILQQVGEHKVTFEFLETLSLRPEYAIKKPYRRKATETVIVIENTERRISLQHILQVPGMGVIKHWRQTWEYEPTVIYEYQGNNTWAPKAISAEEAKGAWSQTVSQVDDSPRYSGVGKWFHKGNLSEWEARSARPLPRREYTKRSDYQILMARNRHTLIPTGWVHEQDNYKLVLDNPTDPVIAREVGFNVYTRTEAVDFSDAYTYWEETKEYWAMVRAHWATIMDGKRTVQLKDKWKKKKLFRYCFELARDSRDGEEARMKAVEEMKEVLAHFLGDKEEPQSTPPEPPPAGAE